MDDIDLSLALPFYNEEKNVEWVLNEMLGSFDRRGLRYELIAVQNGSWDGTSDLIDQFCRKYPQVKKVTVEVNQGYGYGILQGMAAARGRYVGYSPGDGQVPADDIAQVFLKGKEMGLDFMQGLRVRKDTWVRRLNTGIYNFIFHAFFWSRVRDVGSNPKILKREWFEAIGLESKDWFIDGEIILKTHAAGRKMMEFPVTFRKREEGKSKINLAAALQMFKNVLRWKLRTVTGS